MKPDLILIANASEARLLSRDGATAALLALESMRPPDGKPVVGAHPSVRLDPGVPLDPRRRRMRAFAADVAQHVEEKLAGGQFAKLALFAACPFLGALMRQLDRPTKEAMRAVVDADVSDLGWDEAAERIELELRCAAQDACRAHRGKRPQAG